MRRPAAAAVVRERPIIFSGPMVRAILESKKTQTRRLFIKANEHHGIWDPANYVFPARERGWIAWWSTAYTMTPKEAAEMAELTKRTYTDDGIPCPYGEPGDHLWVRETWNFFDDSPLGADVPHVSLDRLGPAAPWHGVQGTRSITWRAAYRADGEISHPVYGRALWRSPLFMHRWASRLLLEVTEVRVQRLQEISEEDARAEGLGEGHDLLHQNVPGDAPPEWMIEPKEMLHLGGMDLLYPSAKDQFSRLWDSLNGKRASWDSNPWVWAISFKRLEVTP
jgi:hypothetical protein